MTDWSEKEPDERDEQIDALRADDDDQDAADDDRNREEQPAEEEKSAALAGEGEDAVDDAAHEQEDTDGQRKRIEHAGEDKERDAGCDREQCKQQITPRKILKLTYHHIYSFGHVHYTTFCGKSQSTAKIYGFYTKFAKNGKTT